MNKQPLNELLPCPFCGENPEIISNVNDAILIRCSTLACIGWNHRVDLKQWNTRISPSNAVESYQCKCCHCKEMFMGDKREVCCPMCAKQPLTLDSEGEVEISRAFFTDLLRRWSDNRLSSDEFYFILFESKASPNREKEKVPLDKDKPEWVKEQYDKKHPLYSLRCDDCMDEIWRTLLVGKISNWDFRNALPIIQKHFDEICSKFSMPDVEVPSVHEIEDVITSFPESIHLINSKRIDIAKAILDLLQKGRK